MTQHRENPHTSEEPLAPVRILGKEINPTQIPIMQISVRKEHKVWRDGGAYLLPYITALIGVITEQYFHFNLDQDLTQEGVEKLVDMAWPDDIRPHTKAPGMVIGRSLFHDQEGVGSMETKFETLEQARQYFKDHGGSEEEFDQAKKRLEGLDRGVEMVNLKSHEENQGVFARLVLHKIARTEKESSYVARFEMEVEVLPDDGQTLFEMLCEDETFLKMFLILGIKRQIDVDAVRKNRILVKWEMDQLEVNERLTAEEVSDLLTQKDLYASEQILRNRALDQIVKDLGWADDAETLFTTHPDEADGLVREVNSNFRLRYLGGIPLENTSVAQFAIEQLKVIGELARHNSLALWFLDEFRSEGIAALIDSLNMFGGLDNVDIFTGMLVEHKTLRKAFNGALNPMSVIRLINSILKSYTPKEVESIQQTKLFEFMVEDLDRVIGLLVTFMDEPMLQAFTSGIRREAMENVADNINNQ
jgi:hypothetical protein